MPQSIAFRFAGATAFVLGALLTACGDQEPGDPAVLLGVTQVPQANAVTPSVSLSVNPTWIRLGYSATLQWNTSNATSCQASVSPATGGGSWSGSRPIGSNSASVTPTAKGPYTYVLTCSGSGGSATATVKLPVESALPPTASLSANPTSAAVGSSTVLTWSSTNAQSCTASGAWSGSKAVSGNQSVVVNSVGNNVYTITCSGPQQSAVASVTVTGTSGGGGGSFTTLFSPNSVTISTSEGAPYGDSDFWIGQDYSQSQYGYGPTKVMRLYICLSGKVTMASCSNAPPPTGPLPAAMLNGISSRIGSYAGTGIRLLIRFNYNFGPIGPGARDVPASLIVTHINQLAPILRQHRDLIFALEAGFIGTWGEWHHSTSGNDTPARRKLVLDRESFHFRGLFPILVRYPADLLTYLNSSTPSPDFGLHDDYYASDPEDAGTWTPRDGYSSATLKSYAAAVAKSSMLSGELGALSQSQQTCSALDSYSYTYRPQTFSLLIWPISIGAYLQGQGCVLKFFNRVGTRIEARSLTVTGTASPGATLHFALTLVNAGFGRVIRPRPATVVLSANGVVLQEKLLPLTQLDLRTLAPGALPVAGVFNFDVTLPSNLPSQPLSVSLLIRDPAPSLASLPAYALPFNSLDAQGQPVFNPANGYNKLATIQSGVIAAVSSAVASR